MWDCWRQRQVMNWLAVRLLYLLFLVGDGRLLWWCRHLGHYWSSDLSPLAWQVAVLRSAARLFLGNPPEESGDGPRDYEGVYVLARWEEAFLRGWQNYRRWRAARLAGGAPSPKKVLSALERAVRWERIRWQYEECPHGFCRRRPGDEWRWRRLTRSMRLLTLRRALADGPLAPPWQALVRVALDDLGEIQYSQPDLAGFIEVVGRRLETGDRDDVRRWQDREELLRNAESHPERAEIAAVLVLDLYREADDWAGLLEAARQTGLRTSRTWATEDHLELGEAHWRHADELPPGELGDWARERAVGHFLLGQCAEHLRGLPARPRLEGAGHEQGTEAGRAVSA
jgi:hypothetical protein